MKNVIPQASLTDQLEKWNKRCSLDVHNLFLVLYLMITKTTLTLSRFSNVKKEEIDIMHLIECKACYLTPIVM